MLLRTLQRLPGASAWCSASSGQPGWQKNPGDRVFGPPSYAGAAALPAEATSACLNALSGSLRSAVGGADAPPGWVTLKCKFEPSILDGSTPLLCPLVQGCVAAPAAGLLLQGSSSVLEHVYLNFSVFKCPPACSPRPWKPFTNTHTHTQSITPQPASLTSRHYSLPIMPHAAAGATHSTAPQLRAPTAHADPQGGR